MFRSACFIWVSLECLFRPVLADSGLTEVECLQHIHAVKYDVCNFVFQQPPDTGNTQFSSFQPGDDGDVLIQTVGSSGQGPMVYSNWPSAEEYSYELCHLDDERGCVLVFYRDTKRYNLTGFSPPYNQGSRTHHYFGQNFPSQGCWDISCFDDGFARHIGLEKHPSSLSQRVIICCICKEPFEMDLSRPKQLIRPGALLQPSEHWIQSR